MGNVGSIVISEIQAIDVHGHFRRMLLGRHALLGEWMTASAASVVERASAANTQWTVVSPLSSLLPRGEADAYQGNEQAASVVARMNGLLQWVVINPLQQATYEQALQMLQTPKCVGIKLHPEEHRYPIREYGRQSRGSLHRRPTKDFADLVFTSPCRLLNQLQRQELMKEDA